MRKVFTGAGKDVKKIFTKTDKKGAENTGK